MPFVKIKNISDDSCWGLWKIEETTDTLISLSFLSNHELEELKLISNLKRKKEWLSARALLKHIVNNHLSLEYQGTYKDENNKPFLYGNAFHISIAHSYPYAVALLNRHHACGIDIEIPKPALFHVAPKFLVHRELKDIKHNSGDLCLAWAAKEVLFKLHGKQKLSFKENLYVDTSSFKNKGSQLTGEIALPEACNKYVMNYEKFDNYVICYSI